ncbi:hypothetical protein [Salinicola avicenniae]|uniref:hypothetical protein n=1 Tax=Salinicola avicenniae TaxID=2916836 RepID=UPI0020734F87|nr:MULTISPECIES: hypothetical protein [unclassified Salinicola]
MIQVTFAHLTPDQPHQGTAFHLDGKYAGYIGQDCTGRDFAYFYRPFWQRTRLREARGYVRITDRSGALSLLRRLVTRLAYRQLMTRARSICASPCASTFYQRVLADLQFQRRLAYALVDLRTWNDPSADSLSSDLAFTPECASQQDDAPANASRAVFRVFPALSYNLIQYTDGSYRRVSSTDIHPGAEPLSVPQRYLTRVACVATPAQQAASPRVFFLPTTVPPSFLAGRHHAAPTTTRNTQ